MTDAARVEGDEKVRLFCGLRLPDDALDAVAAWQLGLEAGRIVPRENLHFTLAFLGWQPRARVAEVVEALQRRCARSAPPQFELERYRETRSVGMLVFSRDRGAERLALGFRRTCWGGRRGTRGCRTSPSSAFASGRDCGRRCRSSAPS